MMRHTFVTKPDDIAWLEIVCQDHGCGGVFRQPVLSVSLDAMPDCCPQCTIIWAPETRDAIARLVRALQHFTVKPDPLVRVELHIPQASSG